MKDYTADAPVFSGSIPIVENNDLVNSDNNNAAAMKLLQNDLVLRTLIEALTQQLENDAQAAKDYTDGAYQQSTGYTDQKIADLINGAPTTLDTLGEIAKAMAENESVVEALHESIGKKANQAEVESWLGTKLDKTGDSGSTTADYTSDDTATPSGWKSFALFTGIEKLKEFAAKVSTMASNLRWLYKMLGSTDISAIGDGTVTGALDVLNSNIGSGIGLADVFTTNKQIETTLNNVTDYGLAGICTPTAPNSPGFYAYILVFKFGVNGSNVSQLAIGYHDSRIAIRYRYNGNWGDWNVFG